MPRECSRPIARLNLKSGPTPFFIQMFVDKLILLHWNLRKADWLKQPEQPVFYRTDVDFQTFIKQNSSMPSISKTYAKPEIHLKPQLGEGTI